jgi:hypothetical protein
MKIKLLIVIFGILIPLLSNGQKPAVYIYHFYTFERCPADLKIEELTNHLLDSVFKKEIASRQIIRKSLNFNLRKNVKLAKKLNVTTIAMIINIVDESGKQSNSDLTDWAFAKVWDEPVFKAELQAKIINALSKINKKTPNN